jgi:hypothetical protein
MPARAVVLTALIASAVSSIVAFALGLLVAAALLHAPIAAAQTPTASNTPSIPAPRALSAAPDASAASPVTVSPVIRAERFELVDASGTVLASLGHQAPTSFAAGDASARGRTALEFVDPAGRPRVGLGVGDDQQAAVYVQDARGGLAALGEGRLTTGASANDLGLILADSGTQQLATVALADGRPVVELGAPFTGAGLVIVTADDGTARIELSGPTGQRLWQAP